MGYYLFKHNEDHANLILVQINSFHVGDQQTFYFT
jgi:hypothetical protein